MPAPERRVALEGTLNFRDLGGYRGLGGRTVRWGLVYRSDNLAAVTAAGWSSLAELGLRSVYDLRHDVERQRAPSLMPEGLGIAATHMPIGGEAAEAPDIIDLLRQSKGAGYGLAFMIEMNRTLLADHATVFGGLLTELAIPERLPAVFHCTAGKDRTGVAAALLLTVLGVDRATILDDYELTTTYRSHVRIAELTPHLEAAGVDVDSVRPFLSAPRPALETALADLDHEGIESYLRDKAGVTDETVARLRANLLT
ncbi:MAG TPA: tyrosine-protein phosphatase [Acidimicrobiia bacterium]|jgi:protein-tyrosine phosphatase|nr:tyrosine-protein phosphatase [Acidimicrobiia bacterium]